MPHLQGITDQAIAILEQVVDKPPMPPIQPGVPYDEVWLGLEALRRAQATMNRIQYERKQQ